MAKTKAEETKYEIIDIKKIDDTLSIIVKTTTISNIELDKKEWSNKVNSKDKVKDKNTIKSLIRKQLGLK